MANPHYSASSSVYSPVEPAFRFRVASDLQPTIHEAALPYDDALVPQDAPAPAHPAHNGTAAASNDKLKTEPSNQTFNSFMTANSSTPSFTSINNSLLRPDSPGSDLVADDQTPRLDASAAYDDVDKTPIVGAWPEDELRPARAPDVAIRNSIEYPSGYKHDDGSAPDAEPHSDLAARFSRLSITLQQNSLKVSNESQQFQLDFSLNVQRANSAHEPVRDARASVYYRKIHAKPKNDLYTAPNDQSLLSFAINQSLPPQSLVASVRNLMVSVPDARLPDMSGGLNITLNDTTVDSDQINPDSSLTASSQDTNVRHSVGSSIDNDSDMSVLFIRALHPFDSTQSQLNSDNSVCLSFHKDDLAFVHTIDDSGWGEVTLIETLDRGWIPMNFFTVAANASASADDEDGERAAQYAQYMTQLLDSCGRFLLNPISHTTRHGKKTFSIKTVNSIRDGVRRLLQETDCLSRSNEVVIKKPVVRKCRKSLLSDWYTLMIKAGDFRGTSNYDKIEILALLVLQVIRRATAFLDVWSKESKEIVKRDTEINLRSDMEKYPLLIDPPFAKQRVTEINSILYSYLSLIIGRLDLIEHNPAGCDTIETIVHHIILLLRELLFISKTGSDYFSEKPPELDGSLDSILSLVNQIVTSLKSLVILTLNEPDRHRSLGLGIQTTNDYSYTDEGKALTVVAARMIKAIGITISCIRKIFESIGDFKLSSERAYPDFSKFAVTPSHFIKTCSVGLVKAHALKVRDLRTMKQNNTKPSNRYSTFRFGKTGELGITPNGVDTLHQVLLLETDGSEPFSSSIKEFKDFVSTDNSKPTESGFSVKDELLVDANENLLGSSFKGLVYTLTNESSPPEYFFVSAFFICFRSFSTGTDLTEMLISRYEGKCNAAHENLSDAHFEVKLKDRRKLVCKIFQIWMESYWDSALDSNNLNTMINFFNEGVYSSLPFEAMRLIEVAAQLVDRESLVGQLIVRNITLAKIKRKNSFLQSRDSASLGSRYSMVDGYQLSKINTNSSVASSLKSMTLPMPLGISGQATSTSSLLTKAQLNTIEDLVSTYRKILGENWCTKSMLTSDRFMILSLTTILPRWYLLNEQNWILSNYRPNLLDFNGLEIAKQFTLIESEIFCAIKPVELVNSNFSAKKAHLNLAPNVRQSLLFTNCLSEYVVESVLQPGINQKVRVNIIKTWLKIAISCLYLRNFNSLAAIITSLQSHLITRLTKVWGELSEKYTDLHEYLCCIIHPDKNYSVYRTKLRSFLLSNDYNIPVVPYFSLFLQDLTFVTDGNPNYRKANTFLNQKLINIDKYLKITRVIADIESLQISYTRGDKFTRSGTLFTLSTAKKRESISSNILEDYSIAPVPALQELVLVELWKISQVNKKEEDRAWKLSCAVQPRDTPQVRGYEM